MNLIQKAVMRSCLIIGFTFLFALWAGFSGATYISMEMSIRPSLEDNAVKVSVDLTNKGDEPAYNVKVSADIGGKTVNGDPREILEVDEQYSEELNTVLEFKKPGRYPVIVIVNYSDRNRYQFTAISIAHVIYKELFPVGVKGENFTASILDKGSVQVKLKNLEPRERRVRLRLVLPVELSATEPPKEVTLEPGAEETVNLQVENRSALMGSNYTVYAIMEYEDDRYYFADAIGGNIIVGEKEVAKKAGAEKEEPEEQRAYKKTLAIAIIIFLAIFGILFLLRRLSRASR